MGTDVAEIVDSQPYPCLVKVHQIMCVNLMKSVDKISKIFPDIEAARPRCSPGIPTLCQIRDALDRAKSLVQNCSESSRLYLALTGNVTVSRFAKSKDLLQQGLSQIKNMVPVPLAKEISLIIEDLKGINFNLEPSEEEAGKAVRALFQSESSISESIENREIQSLKLAAEKLHIQSSRALLIEKRAIRKLLNKIGDDYTQKKKILRQLLYLLKKHGRFLVTDQNVNESPRHEEAPLFANSCMTPYGQNVKEDCCVEYGKNKVKTEGILTKPVPPEEFICPLSLGMMNEPVVIESGQTFEMTAIKKWFDNGNIVCPKTKEKLANTSMTPNTVIRELISQWSREHGSTAAQPYNPPEIPNSLDFSSTSISSLGSSVNEQCFRLDFSNISLGSLDTSYTSESSLVKITDDLCVMTMPTPDESRDFHSDEIARCGEPDYLSELAELSWESQCKAIEDFNSYMICNDQACSFMLSGNFVAPLIKFLEDAGDQHDVNALRSGCQLLLAFVNTKRNEKLNISDDVFRLLASLLVSDASQAAIEITEVLSRQHCYRPKIAACGSLLSKILNFDSHVREFQESAIKILYNVSSDSENRAHIVALDCIPKLVPLMADASLAKYCIVILKNLCESEEARASISETKGCIATIAELLENGSQEDQEHAVSVLLSICSQRVQYCQLVMEENVFTALASISVNGNDRAKVGASKLLRTLTDSDDADVQKCPVTHIDNSRDSSNNSEEKRSSNKPASGFFERLSMFAKPNSLSSRKKKRAPNS